MSLIFLAHLCILHGGLICVTFCLSVRLYGLDQKSDWIIIHVTLRIEDTFVMKTTSKPLICQCLNLKPQINACYIGESQGGLTAKVKLHFLEIAF